MGAASLMHACVSLRDRGHPALVLLVAVLDAVAILSLFAVSFTEPGILLRRQPRLAQAAEPPRVQLDGSTMVLKWCKTCNIYRPPRSKVCSLSHASCQLCSPCLATFSVNRRQCVEHHC